MKQQRGFTVIELLVAIVFTLAAGTIFMIQKNDLDVTHRDTQRKTAINAFFYGLKKVYYTEHKSYPETLDEKTLAFVDPTLFKDPNGKKLGDQQSDYRYEPTSCNNGKCQGFTLRADLQKEKDYIKTNNSK